LIKVGETKGVVLSIDLLSIKLRTFDNQLVRIPNENLIKNELSNITRFPIRRLDIDGRRRFLLGGGPQRSRTCLLRSGRNVPVHVVLENFLETRGG